MVVNVQYAHDPEKWHSDDSVNPDAEIPIEGPTNDASQGRKQMRNLSGAHKMRYPHPYGAGSYQPMGTQYQPSPAAPQYPLAYGAPQYAEPTPLQPPKPSPAERYFSKRDSSADIRSTIGQGQRQDDITASVPSVKDSWASGYLKRRKEAREEEERSQQWAILGGPPNAQPTSFEPIQERLPSRSPEKEIIKAKEPPTSKALALQQEYLQRLLAAHNTVDELLKKRGKQGDDESKYLKTYEWGRDRESTPLRSTSSDSDSGLSLDSLPSPEEPKRSTPIRVIARRRSTITPTKLISAEINAEAADFAKEEESEEVIFCVLIAIYDETEASFPESVGSQEELISQRAKPKAVKKRLNEAKQQDEIRLVIPTPKDANFHTTTKTCEPDVELKHPLTKPSGTDPPEKVNSLEPTDNETSVSYDDKQKSVENTKAEPKTSKKTVNTESKAPEVTLNATPSALPKYAQLKVPSHSKATTVNLHYTRDKPDPKKAQKLVKQISIQDETLLKFSLPKHTEAKETTCILRKQKAKSITFHVKRRSSLDEGCKKQGSLNIPDYNPKDRSNEQKTPGKLKRQQTEPELEAEKTRKVGRLQLQQPAAGKNENTKKLIVPKLKFNREMVSQSSTAANFRNKPENPQSASISVQHCSFYEIREHFSAPNKQKCLRIHLRLTNSNDEEESTNTVQPCSERKQSAFCEISDPNWKAEAQKRKKERAKNPVTTFANGENSVRSIQDRLKKKQAYAREIQDVRGNLKRVPKLTSTKLNKPELLNQSRRDIGKKSKKMTKLQKRDALRATKDEKRDDKKKFVGITKKREDNKDEVANVRMENISEPRHPTQIEEWETRLIQEFRRRLHIPVLEAIYKRIFCFNCTICHLLTGPKPPPRAKFISRRLPERWPIPEAEKTELENFLDEWYDQLQLHHSLELLRSTSSEHHVAVLNPFGVTLRKVSHQKMPVFRPSKKPKRKFVPRWRRNRSGEELEEEEEEEEPESEAAPPPAAVAEDTAAPSAEGEEEKAVGGDEENEPPQDDAGEDAAPEERRPSRVPPPATAEPDPESMTEAEQAMLAAKKRHEEEQALKMMDSESRRKAELQQVEEELKVLKERQIERRKQRAIEEQEFAERRRQDEERRRKEEEERKQKLEAERARRQEEKMRKNMMMAGALGMSEVPIGDGPNFVVSKSGKGLLGNEEQKNKFGLSKEQKEEQKQNFLAAINKPEDVSNCLPNDIKEKIKRLHAKIVKLEAEKYDLEIREGRQEYDLKELFEREKQVARQKALKAGVEPTEEEGNSRRPTKKIIFSKFDRQVDRRSYGDRRELFEHPVVKPPPSIVHGSGRPPPEWGKRDIEELEQLRKNLEPFRYQEQVKAEGDAAKPPVPVIPLQVPTEEFDPTLAPKPKAPAAGENPELEIVEEPVDGEAAPEETATA
ncbi:unnamed protein product [Bursaphelenchus xylophilus]|uniref:(pine wood nematode) hypothetical protein n=1 Tax=Bursaphelenchus xylophilus TaxID=6326 RepID=A0A811L034_BURXY|nr:unnamed protein product [Bursaphelenchus xylophilus]CAG9108560.1 unnamed protein product [Bursaphelenchus xylophilus]